MNTKLIEKIKKMFALANCAGASPGEAENAMRMANKLMEKHKLCSMDLKFDEEITLNFGIETSHAWVRQLYNAVARVYSCSMFTQGTNIIMMGTLSNLTTAGIVIDALVENIEKAGKGKGITFKNGASSALVNQCWKLIDERKKSTEVTGSGLVLADHYDEEYDRAKATMDKKFNLTKGRASKMRQSAEGRAYGASLNPNAHLSNKLALN